MKKTVVLTVIDGLGLRDEVQGNAVKQAETPVIDNFLAEYPWARIGAAGEHVGLPSGQIGNSEVGHLNIGAGEMVYTGLALIRKAINDGVFGENEAFAKSIQHAKDNNSTIHLVGMLSPGGVHSLEEHLFLLIDSLHEKGVKNVSVHAFTDGRDVKPRSVEPSLDKLMSKLDKYGYHLASIGGRLYGMDRDENFDKTEFAYDAIRGECNRKFNDIFEYVKNEYDVEDNNDEFINVAINENENVNFLNDKDSIIFFNFRPDRARQIAHLFIPTKLYNFTPKNQVKDVQLTTMMKYEGVDKADVAFDSQFVENPIGKVLSEGGLTQLRVAETQKIAHVTFFMDGGKEIQYPNSERILVDSIKVDNFADAPLMSATGITDAVIDNLGKVDVIIMNYANPDMVGHTGNLEAAKIAVSHLDKELGRLKDAVENHGGTLFITADHGNSEITEDEDGNPATKHTTSDVFLITTDKNLELEDGVLANITPTVLDYINVKSPENHTHKSLIKK